MKKLLLLPVFLLSLQIAHAVVYGCTDPKANNYNASATNNDGSCTYNGSNVAPLVSRVLNAALDETSGLIFWNNTLWSHNDDTDIKLYAVDSATADTVHSYALNKTVNTDWEEISQDENYVYVGDFGNNANGNRTDLHILRVEKNSLLMNSPVIDTIWFSYSNQANFSPAGPNHTDFDCEAFLITSDSIYLFTKQWISLKTSVYAMPKNPGTYTAILRSTINVNGLVTGITYLEDRRLAVMIGYSDVLQPFFYLLYDFQNNDFANGNKRKVIIANLPFHQTEGIATANGLRYFVSNEKMTSPIANAQKLHTFDLTNFLGTYLNSIPTNISIKTKEKFSIYPNPTSDIITIKLGTRTEAKGMITDSNGKKMMDLHLHEKENTVNISSLPAGIYMVHIEGMDTVTIIKK